MIKRVVFLLTIFMASVSLVEAKDTGKSRAQFLKIGIGSRAVGMGEAFCGLSDDISAIYWNPAGLSQLRQTEVMTTHLSYFQGVNSEHFACVHPNKNGSALGVSLTMLGVDGIKRYDKNNTQHGDFKADDMAVSIAASRMFGQGAAIGTGLKLIKQGLDDKDTTNLAVDLGGLYHPGIDNLVIGAAVQNIGIKSGNKKRGEVDDPMPFRMRLGASYQLQRSTICVDINMPGDGPRTTNLGIEYALPKVMKFGTMLRAGYRMGADTGKFSLGLGVLSNRCSFDYAFAPYGDLGNSHRVSTSLRFGASKPKQRVASIEPAGKKTEQLVSWINVQRFVLGMFIEEKDFPEHLQKKKDDKKKMPVLPGINAPSETAKGSSTTGSTEPAEVRKNIDFDKAADEIDFESGEEAAEAAPTAGGDTQEPQSTAAATGSSSSQPSAVSPQPSQPTAAATGSTQAKPEAAAVPTPAAATPADSGGTDKPQPTTVTAGASSPQPSQSTAAVASSPQAKPEAAAVPTPAAATPAASGGTDKPQPTAAAASSSSSQPSAVSPQPSQPTAAAAGSTQAKPEAAVVPTPAAATPADSKGANKPQSTSATAGTSSPQPSSSTRFRFMDIAPIDEGELMN